jgi:hypothetical protein
MDKNTSVTTVEYNNFGSYTSGRVVTARGNKKDGWTLFIVYARNPYGTHNLILVYHDENDGTLTAYRHGNHAVLEELVNGDRKIYRRARNFLLRKGVGADWNAVSA